MSSKDARKKRALSEPNIQPVFENRMKTTEILSGFIKETGYENCRVLFSLQNNSLSAREFNECVGMKSHIMILVRTNENEWFGFYHEDPLCYKHNRKIVNSTKSNFFIFGRDKIIRPYKSDFNATKSVIMHSTKEDSFVVTCVGAFWVLSDGTATVHPSIKSTYDIPELVLNPLCKTTCGKAIRMKQFVALEWY
ncbi:hypothetical protein EIN_391510 [Entamoeba invadens IP1]|uniref:TLDc domain-containing protein n=2 Tax=Entamoeba invadens TaxID=33085 RepID=A0A0A1UBB6_ENTIV|nr:hypothetical protein EIN_391510 [Entamoeba invadens IP1]ELP89496.1 hypothetical protein EIN_391510 [Entamoeba invadens IP1]|eukprot:XP_004256267.1 hypothetical protein EIN_391510 [Entamoeba invadens IP1]